MARTLYLTPARAEQPYVCPGCMDTIPRGGLHFRHDPQPPGMFRGEQISHWCTSCIGLSLSGAEDWIEEHSIKGRIRVSLIRATVRFVQPGRPTAPSLTPARVELVGIGRMLTERLLVDPSLLHRLAPGHFEEFVCDRLYAMGLEPKRVGHTYRRDGGIDVLFWPRTRGVFPFLGAAQVMHHRDPAAKEGLASVREFAGVIAGHPLSAGLLITNTSFSPDAEWYARHHAKLVRLRSFRDLQRWLVGNFGDEEEWREVPSSIELCPGLVITVRG